MSNEFFEQLQKLDASINTTLSSLIPEIRWAGDGVLCKASKTYDFNGEKGVWRRVGGMNLFLREGDGVILNGPRALRGQKMANISSDDFKAIPHVRAVHEKKGDKAVPGQDIEERITSIDVTTLQGKLAKAVVRRGFNKIYVTLYRLTGQSSWSPVESKEFDAGKDEVAAFEKAKAWARPKIRAMKKKR